MHHKTLTERNCRRAALAWAFNVTLLLIAAATPPAALAAKLPKPPRLAKSYPRPPPPFPSPPATGRCHFCANVTVTYPSNAAMNPRVCTIIAGRIKADLTELYKPVGGKPSNLTTSCLSNNRTIKVCGSVRSAALAAVPQAALDSRVAGWAQGVRGYTVPTCVPLLSVVAQIGKNAKSCIYSKRSHTVFCDAWPSRVSPPPRPPTRP